jgi:hypothetical protein
MNPGNFLLLSTFLGIEVRREMGSIMYLRPGNTVFGGQFTNMGKFFTPGLRENPEWFPPCPARGAYPGSEGWKFYAWKKKKGIFEGTVLGLVSLKLEDPG